MEGVSAVADGLGVRGVPDAPLGVRATVAGLPRRAVPPADQEPVEPRRPGVYGAAGGDDGGDGGVVGGECARGADAGRGGWGGGPTRRGGVVCGGRGDGHGVMVCGEPVAGDAHSTDAERQR
eukprot:ctg_3183.g414